MRKPLSELEENQLNGEWVIINTLREIFGISRGGQAPTYPDTLRYAQDIAPKLFNSDSSFLIRSIEDPDVRKYRQLAKASSIDRNETVTPTQVIDEEILKLDRLIKATDDPNPSELKKDRIKLRKIRDKIEPPKVNENDVIRHDSTVFANQKIASRGNNYTEFLLPENRALRICILHPNKAEHITGADMIYEYYEDDSDTEKDYENVFLAAMQYKLWNGESFYIDSRVEKQIEKLQNSFCAKGLCEAKESETPFRLPFCSAFLRLTDKKQSLDDHLSSSGFHIRICALAKVWDSTEKHKKISSRKLKRYKGETINQQTFSFLFKENMLGSRCLSRDDLDSLYKEYEILSSTDTVIIHAQECSIPTKLQANNAF